MELGIYTFADTTPDPATGTTISSAQRIRLTSAVTVLSSDDPVRVFQDLATLDLLSGRRAETSIPATPR